MILLYLGIGLIISGITLFLLAIRVGIKEGNIYKDNDGWHIIISTITIRKKGIK